MQLIGLQQLMNYLYFRPCISCNIWIISTWCMQMLITFKSSLSDFWWSDTGTRASLYIKLFHLGLFCQVYGSFFIVWSACDPSHRLCYWTEWDHRECTNNTCTYHIMYIWFTELAVLILLYIVASELKDPIWHSSEWQIGSFSSEATICCKLCLIFNGP